MLKYIILGKALLEPVRSLVSFDEFCKGVGNHVILIIFFLYMLPMYFQKYNSQLKPTLIREIRNHLENEDNKVALQ